MSSGETLTATAYLQVRKGEPPWRDGKVVKNTQKKPAQLEPNCILVKIKLRIPMAAFAPFEPVAEVVIPAELIQTEIAVEAWDPTS